MPSRKIELQLEALAALKRSDVTAETGPLLRKALADPAGIVTAKAAEVAAQFRMQDLVPDLLKAYERLFEQGVKRDPQCWGKIAIANALKSLDYSNSEPFVRALSYQQWEPVWGTEVDTAAALRAVCSLALVQCSDGLREDKLWQLMRALTDAAPGVRLDAARALEQIEGREAVLLLRLKARMGDKDPAITGQILHSLLALEGSSAIELVAEFLNQRGWPDKDTEVSEQAALALGSSRLPKAIEALVDFWGRRTNGQVNTEAVLRAISSSRQEQALEFLFELIRDGRQTDAIAAIEALGLHANSENIRLQAKAAVEERDNAEINAAFARVFK